MDEYIDKPNLRVTIRLHDQSTGHYTTYYKLGDPRRIDTITRFDELEQECHIEKVSSNWRLNKLSKLVSLLPSEYQINPKSKLKSLAIGTGSILYIVMNKLNKRLLFDKTSFDEERFTQLNYFSVMFDLSEEQKKRLKEFTSDNQLTLRLTVGMSAKQSDQQSIQTGDSWEIATSNMTQLNRVPYSIVMDIVERRRAASIDASQQQDDKIDEAISAKTVFYGFLIDYYMTRPLDSSSNNNQNNQQFTSDQLTLMDPFTMPLGLWCWVGQEASVYSLELDHDQFSAIYYDELHTPTDDRTAEMFYMAYDGKTKTLRYDRPDWKTIIDLRQYWAYHISKNTTSADDENNQTVDESDTTSYNFPPLINIDALQHKPSADWDSSKCSLIEMDKTTISNQYKDLAHILGLSSSERIYLMGQTKIDGLDCHVYERLVIPDQLPKILGFRPIEAELVYFLIVYVVHDNSLLDSELALDYSTAESWPKRLTLLSYNTATKKRQIETSLMFTQFSWTLQVAPNEADLSSVVRSVHLFDVDECAPKRRGRAKLEFSIVQEDGETFSAMATNDKSDFLIESRWKTLTTRAQSTLQQWIMEHIVESYSLSRARVTNLEVTVRRRDLFVRATLLELPDAHCELSLAISNLVCYLYRIIPDTILISQFFHLFIIYICFILPSAEIKSLGYFADNYPAEELVKLANHWENTRIIYSISLEECHLEGATSLANMITYCPNYYAMCIIVAQSDMPLVSSSRFVRGSTSDKSFCSVYTIQQVSSHSKYSLNTLGLFLTDSHRLLTAKLIRGKVKLLQTDENTTIAERKRAIEFKYVARVDSVKISLMDPIREVEALNGLGYLIINVDDGVNNSVMNANYVKSISEPEVNHPVGLIYCHKACQLSDHCHSWSFCRSRTTQSWCTLTNLELTQSALVDLSQLKTTDDDGAKQRLPLKYSSGGGHVYYLEHNDQCSLHSKDYHQLYEKLNASKESVQLQPDQLKQFAFVTLDECARLCFRHELPYDEKDNYQNNANYQVCENFDYCPVISLCHFDGISGGSESNDIENDVYSQQTTNKDPLTMFKGRHLEQQFNSKQQCHRYGRNYVQYFHKRPFLRLTITDSISGKEISSSNDVVTRLANLNFNQCIRHCVLADQRCLAFDYCQASMTSTCLTYTIKSSSASTDKNSPDNLTSEADKQYYYFAKQTTEVNTPIVKYKVELRDEERCNHYALISTYVNVKSSLAEDRYFTNSKILEQDQDISESIKQPGLFKNPSFSSNNKINDTKASKKILANCATFAIGLMMGMLIYLVVPSYVMRWIQWRQKNVRKAVQSTEAIRFRVFSSTRKEQRQKC